MPRFLCRFAALAVLCAILTLRVGAAVSPCNEAAKLPLPSTPAPQTSAKAMLLLEADEGIVLAQKNADVRLPMASTTKVMTALVALETLSLDATVTVPHEAVGTEGSSIYLFEGEQITVRTLLYALMLSSANDAAVALAIAAAGSVDAFVALMNERAEALGLIDTHFCNPHGLHDEQHYTTAQDLARLYAAAMKNATFAEITSTARYTAPQSGTDAARLLVNHNRLLRTLEGTIGGKTGFTKAAGRCLVSATRRDGLTLIAVTLHAPSDWEDHRALHEWGFSNYARYTLSPPAITLPVVGGERETVTLTVGEHFSTLLPRDHAQILCKTEHPRFLYAGFARGEQVGRVILEMNGEALAVLPLLTADACATPKKPTLWVRFRAFFSHSDTH